MTLEATNPLPEMEDLKDPKSPLEILTEFKATYQAFKATLKTSRAIGRDTEAFWSATGDALQVAYDALKKINDERGDYEKSVVERHDNEATLTVAHVLTIILSGTPDYGLRAKIERVTELFQEHLLIPVSDQGNPEEKILRLLS